jgi:hypothetical protein
MAAVNCLPQQKRLFLQITLKTCSFKVRVSGGRRWSLVDGNQLTSVGDSISIKLTTLFEKTDIIILDLIKGHVTWLLIVTKRLHGRTCRLSARVNVTMPGVRFIEFRLTSAHSRLPSPGFPRMSHFSDHFSCYNWQRRRHRAEIILRGRQISRFPCYRFGNIFGNPVSPPFDNR